MSWSIYFKGDDGKLLDVENFTEGGTVAIGGTGITELNITYNYSEFYRRYLDKEEGLDWLDGKKAIFVLGRLEKAVKALGTKQYTAPNWVVNADMLMGQKPLPEGVTERDFTKFRKKYNWDAPKHRKLRDKLIRMDVLRDGGAYWKPTKGNAGYALNILWQWAKKYPGGVFEVH